MSAVVKPRQRAGSWASFVRRYRPIEQQDGDVVRSWSDRKVLGANERLIWTLVDCDGTAYVVPGFHTVNYVGRILCEIEWSDIEELNPGYVF